MSGWATRTASARLPFRSEMNGRQTGQQDQPGDTTRDPGAPPDRRAHVVVDLHERTAVVSTPACSLTCGVQVIPAGDDNDVIEDHVPDNDGSRDPQRAGESHRSPRPHTSNYHTCAQRRK